MAKRKKHTTRRKHHSRRRVSGVKDVDFSMLAFAAVGAVGARILTNKLTASTNTTMQKIAPFSGVILGIALPMVAGKNAMVKDISIGLVAGGAVSALGSSGLKVISGLENTIAGGIGYPYNVLPYKKVSGIEDGGNYVTKPNFSGSGKSQMNVISGIHAGDAMGCANGLF